MVTSSSTLTAPGNGEQAPEQVKKLAEKFEFLDKLRDSGKINMFAAPSFLVKKFKINRDAAQRITSQWVKSFDGTTSAEDRARAAIATGAA